MKVVRDLLPQNDTGTISKHRRIPDSEPLRRARRVLNKVPFRYGKLVVATVLGAAVVAKMGSEVAVSDLVDLRLWLSVVIPSAVALIPGFLCAAYVRMSKPEGGVPVGLLSACFVLGGFVTVFAGVLNAFAFGQLAYLSVVSVPLFFLFVGPVEEALKLLAVYLYPADHANDPIDYAVLGAFAGLGFAFVENIFYISSGVTGAEAFLIGRVPVAPLHVMLSAVAGYYLGKARLGGGGFVQRLGTVVKGLTVVGFIHVVYNVFVHTVAGGAPTSTATLAMGFVALVGVFVAIAVILEYILTEGGGEGPASAESVAA